MKTKIIAIFLALCTIFALPISALATEPIENQEESMVTFKANFSDPKIAYYYAYVYVTVIRTDVKEKYSYLLYEENDFSYKTTLPNGNYTITAGGIENDLDCFVPEQHFTVGDTPNTLVEFKIYKDMSSFPEIPDATTTSVSTTVLTETTTLTEVTTNLQETTTEQFSSATSITETTTSNISELQEDTNSPSNIFAIIIIILFAAGIIVLIVFLIKKYR